MNRIPLFLSALDVATLVRRRGLRPCIVEITEALAQDFLRWPQFDKSARAASHSSAGVIELMPVSDGELYAFKYVNGHPGNTRQGLPTVMAFGVLAEVATGMPLLMADLSLATALRTAATSVLAARHVARTGSRAMALIGNGAQAEFQAIAFQHMLGIRSLRVFDIDTQATDKLVRHLAGSGLAITVCASAAEAARGCDIVTTATADKQRAAIVQADMIQPGMHLNAIGGDCPGKTELAPEVLAGARVFVEYAPQTRVEGDIQQMPPDFPVTELWQVLAGHAPGRTSDKEVTVFDSVGFALEDFSTLGVLWRAARQLGLGQPWPLLPRLEDPKDLYGTLGLDKMPAGLAAETISEYSF